MSSFFHSFTHAQIQSLYQKNFQKKILREFPWLIDYKIEFGKRSIMKIVSFTRGWLGDSWKKCWLGTKLDTKEQNLVYITLNFVFFAFMMRLFEKFKDNIIVILRHYLMNFEWFDIQNNKSTTKPIFSYLN